MGRSRGLSTILVSLGEQKGFGWGPAKGRDQPSDSPAPRGGGGGGGVGGDGGQAWCSMQGNWAEWINGGGRHLSPFKLELLGLALETASPPHPPQSFSSNC